MASSPWKQEQRWFMVGPQRLPQAQPMEHT